MALEEVKDPEKEAAALEEPENLDDVDLGLSTSQVNMVYARERFSMASSYQILMVRMSTVRASINANKSVGNTDAVKNFEKQLADLERDTKHCLRGIKTIDKECKEAKALMQKEFK